MKAAVVQPDRSLRIEEVPTPEASAGSVVVKVAFCGICGSDLHLLEAGFLPAGCVIGHELSGTVAQVGAGVQGWHEGDAVVVLPMDPCFACEPCRRGDVQICKGGVDRSYGLGTNPGGFSAYMRVRPSMLFRVPPGLGLREAALNEPWSVAVHGVNLSGFRMGASAAIMGAGPIGLLTLSALKAGGAVGIQVSEPDPFRAGKARAAGADLVLDPSHGSISALIQERTGGLPRFVFDCAGTATSFQEATDIADHHGVVTALGVPMGGASLFPISWFLKELRLAFSFGYSYSEFGSCLKLLAQGAVDADLVVSDVMPLAEIDEAFKRLRGSGHTKILIDCQAC